MFALLLNTFVLMSFASSGTIYESENNNSYTAANETYDDYDNFGSISSSSDVDWWKISFSDGGLVNFWVGELPSGCNYDIYLYTIISGQGLVRVAYSAGSGDDLIRYRVYADSTYYVKINSASGYSNSNYKFRVKRNYVGSGNIYTYHYQVTTSLGTTITNTRQLATDTLPHLWKTGYDSGEYLNNAALTVKTALPNKEISIICNHGAPGMITCSPNSNGSNLTKIYANSGQYLTSQDFSLSSLSSGALNSTNLIAFVGCSTGETGQTYGNLVDRALEKGSKLSVGWIGDLYISDAVMWFDHFFELYQTGNYTIESAEQATDTWILTQTHHSNTVVSKYWGTSAKNTKI